MKIQVTYSAFMSFVEVEGILFFFLNHLSHANISFSSFSESPHDLKFKSDKPKETFIKQLFCLFQIEVVNWDIEVFTKEDTPVVRAVIHCKQHCLSDPSGFYKLGQHLNTNTNVYNHTGRNQHCIQ